MNANATIFNSYPRPLTLNLPETGADAGASPSLLARAWAALDAWSAPQAESRAESRVWDIVSSDPSVMAKLIQAPARNVSENRTVTAAKAIPAQGLGVLLECVHQSRQRQRMAVAAF